MPPTFAAMSRAKLGVCVALSTSAITCCGPQNGIVGRVNQDAAAASVPAFAAQFADNKAIWSIDTALPGAQVTFGVADSAAEDNAAAELVFPGSTSFGPGDAVGPDYVTQIATLQRFAFGTLHTRVNFGSCASTEDVIQAVLGYYNDGTDANGNGITDDIEIDLQVSCALPQYVYLTVFTDYQADANGTMFRKLSHIVDFSTGDEYDTPADDVDAYAASGTDANLKRPHLVATNAYTEVGFDWHRDQVRFFLFDGSEEVTLWTLRDPSHIPQLPVYLMYNLWHPDSHWYPATGPADFPAHDVIMKLDWVRYEPSTSD